MASLAGEVYVVVGAGSGIGAALADVLAARGASLCLADVDKAGLETTLARIALPEKKVTSKLCDMSDRAGVRSLMDHVMEFFGRVDGCANVGGISGKEIGRKPVWEASLEEHEKIFAINAKGVWNCMAEQLRPGVLGSGGSIVNVSSIEGLRGMVGSSSYSASKHAVIGMTRSAAKEAGPRNIRINTVAPGAIDTPMLRKGLEGKPHTLPKTPLERYGTPEEVANVIIFLMSKESSFVTGSVYSVDGGWCA